MILRSGTLNHLAMLGATVGMWFKDSITLKDLKSELALRCIQTHVINRLVQMLVGLQYLRLYVLLHHVLLN